MNSGNNLKRGLWKVLKMKIPVFKPLVVIDEEHVFSESYMNMLIGLRFGNKWSDGYWQETEIRIMKGIQNEDTG